MMSKPIATVEQYLQISFPQTDSEQKEILIARLSDIGFTGFDESDRQLVAFIALEAFDEKAFEEIIGAASFQKTIIEQRNWNEEWESSFEPVIVDEYCVIRASFHAPVQSAKYELIITPKMSFGTGHHATTYQMIQLMSQLDLNGKTILDFGAGAGTLAILAEKLGAAGITAIDNDPWSIENARENVAANNCQAIQLLLKDSLSGMAVYDCILANINKHIILQQMAAMNEHLQPQGVLLISGLLTGDRQEVVEKADSFGLTVIMEKSRENWIALALSRT